jgi:GT2 family glycosyltransferase
MTGKNKISIVILNWNGSSFLRRFLPSVIAHSKGNVEIIVADNNSTDDSKLVTETEFPSVTYLQLEQNWGFAEGYNRALSSLNSDYYVLLNSDVEVTEGWLEPLLKIMDTDLSVGICQPKILSLSRPDEFEYAGASGGFIDYFGYPYCRGRILQVIEKDLGQYNEPMAVSWASGACMMVRSSLWKECGGFDADFWAHMEEIDFCWRARHMGYSTYVCPESAVFHVGGGTLNYNSPLKIYLNFRNNLYLLIKNLPWRQLVLKLPARMILDGMAAFVFLLKGETKSCGRVFAAHMKFYANLSSMLKKRRLIFRTRKTHVFEATTDKSIVWNYFITKRRMFSELHD